MLRMPSGDPILFKRILFGGAAAGALTTAYLVGSISLGGVFAQTNPTPTPANEASETAALASQAKVTADQARAAALARFPGATVGKTELDNENGVVAYSVARTAAPATPAASNGRRPGTPAN